MVRALVVSVCLSVVALAGCGTSRNPAEADCDFYVENELCPTLQQCGATYSSLGDCINHFENSHNTVIDCSTVTIENPGLSACEADTNYSDCGYVVSGGYATLPNSCIGVFN